MGDTEDDAAQRRPTARGGQLQTCQSLGQNIPFELKKIQRVVGLQPVSTDTIDRWER